MCRYRAEASNIGRLQGAVLWACVKNMTHQQCAGLVPVFVELVEVHHLQDAFCVQERPDDASANRILLF